MEEELAISKKVMQMKFMQRPREEQLRAAMVAEQQRRARESHWVIREETSASVISLEESVLWDRYTPGRRSWRGFNPAIEAMVVERKAEDHKRTKAEAQDGHEDDQPAAKLKKAKEEMTTMTTSASHTQKKKKKTTHRKPTTQQQQQQQQDRLSPSDDL
jgi:hypothetical protein